MKTMTVLHFSKMTAAGNDFICVDATNLEVLARLEAAGLPALVRKLCPRGLGVGADGFILAVPKSGHPFAEMQARFFDPDGSEVELCGNGTACFTDWALTSKLARGPEVCIVTPAGLARGKRNPTAPGRVRVCIPSPRDLRFGVRVEADGRSWDVDTVTTGVPHAVVFVEAVAAVDVRQAGGLLRRHPAFGPRGVNVNFTQVLEVGRIAVRTFEFGVEDETLACGTGSSSAAFITALREHWPERYMSGEEPVLVEVRGGETLKVWFIARPADNVVEDVCMETRVKAVYDGVVRPEFMG